MLGIQFYSKNTYVQAQGLMLSRFWTRGLLICICLINWIPADRTYSDECFHKWQYLQCLFWSGMQNCTPLGRKPWAHQKQLENGRTIQQHPLATALLLLPISCWSSIFGVPMLLFTAPLLSTAKTTFGMSSRADVNILSSWMFPFITLGIIQNIWADCVHLPQPNRLAGATYILSIDM